MLPENETAAGTPNPETETPNVSDVAAKEEAATAETTGVATADPTASTSTASDVGSPSPTALPTPTPDPQPPVGSTLDQDEAKKRGWIMAEKITHELRMAMNGVIDEAERVTHWTENEIKKLLTELHVGM